MRDIGMRDAPDTEIWSWALANGAVIVSKDEDFAWRRNQAHGPQVVWLRIGNTANAALIRHLERVWPTVLECLESGEPVVEA